MNAADSHRHQLLPSKMHLFALLARSSRLTSLKRGWKHLKNHLGSPGKASTVLALFYLQALAGEMVPEWFWGCSMGKTLIGIISLVAAVTELSSPITETHPGELWLLGFLEMPKIGEKPWWKSLGCFSRHHLTPGSGRWRMNRDGTQKAAEILLPPEHPTERWAPNTPGRKKWDRSEAEQEGTGHWRCWVENEEKSRIFASNRRAQGQGFACEVSAGSIGHNPGRAALPAPQVLN